MAIRTLRTSTSYSVLLHSVLIALMVMTFRNTSVPVLPKKLHWIEVELPPDQARQKKSDSAPDQRFVETQPGTQTDNPAQNAFLGERTQTVDRPSVSRKRQTRTARQGAPRPATPEVPSPSEGIQRKSLSHLGLPILPSRTATKKPDATQDFARNQTSLSDGEDSTSLTSQAPQEYLKGFDEAEQTQLNTKESVFFPYIQRIRERLDIAWERTLHERLKRYFNQGRSIQEGEELATQVLVTLDSTGDVKRVQIIEGSGIRDLDSSAVDAFRIAGPFPNPPKGLLNAQGNVEIRWDLVVLS